jgi:hypothetical protein
MRTTPLLFSDMLDEHERGIRAGFLWINRANNRLAALYQAPGWRFDGLEDYFYFRALRPLSALYHRTFCLLP